jgi:hypothetical protein
MITIVCSSQHPLDEFQKTITKSCGIDPKKIQFLGYENKGEFSLSEIYNRGLKESINDIVVFLHNDITVETNQWGKKLLKIFEKKPEYGIIGVAGTKDMPSSGMWWENRKKMYGRVKHAHEGKTWMTAYSDDLGTEIEEVVVVDGVFFAVNKTKLKQNFDESVKGFHFYEITFCFKNYLENVKLGVTTLIKINHQSIGMTNESWDNNRKDFAEQFKDKLPVSIKKKLRKGERFKILLSATSFDDNSPKSKIILELATKLRKKNHDVVIWSNMSGKTPNIAKLAGIDLTPIQQPPGFVAGDGKWKLKTNNGDIVSQPNTLYKIKDINFSIIQVFDDEMIEVANRYYPDTNLVNTAFENALFQSTNNSINVKKTITLKKDINVDEIINEYLELI